MGMFDEVRFIYPLPLSGANAHVYQTKSLECELTNYEVRADGTLWRNEYDIEDRSDPTAEGVMRLFGMMTRINQRWEPTSWTGELDCYDFDGPKAQGWIEWKVVFVDGKIHRIELREQRAGEPPSTNAVDPSAQLSGTPTPRDKASSS